MKQLVTAASTNLILLGVSPEQQAVAPTYGNFPPQFNENYRGIWQRAVDHALETQLTADKQWDHAVKHYIRECIQDAVDPFGRQDDTGNGEVLNYLLVARRRVVKYIDEWKILAVYPPRWNSEQLTIDLSEEGITIRSSVVLRHINLRRIKDELLKRKFFRFKGPYNLGKVDWRRRIFQHPIWVGFSAASDFEGILWYEIHMPKRPNVKLLQQDLLFNHEQKFERFVKRSIWTPIAKTIRFATIPKRISTF